MDSTSRIITVKPLPTKLFFEKIEIINFPLLDDNANSWDVGSGPDLFVEIVP